MESILQSSLLADAVAEELKAQVQNRRRSADTDPLHKPTEQSPVSALELKLRERALRDREKALKEREERLERKALGAGCADSAGVDAFSIILVCK